ncbi:MAG: hypothetical protein V4655_04390 [Bdellovibrionota bacterium]
MKGLKWIGLVIVLIAIGVGLMTAMDMGEKSPLFVSGEVVLPEGMRGDATGVETLFIIVYDEASQMPMPFGAQKEKMPKDLTQPIPFLVTKEALRVMNPDAPPPRTMRVKVRIDKDGVAGPDQPGDLTGEVTGVAFGTRDQLIEIKKKAE